MKTKGRRQSSNVQDKRNLWESMAQRVSSDIQATELPGDATQAIPKTSDFATLNQSADDYIRRYTGQGQAGKGPRKLN